MLAQHILRYSGKNANPTLKKMQITWQLIKVYYYVMPDDEHLVTDLSLSLSLSLFLSLSLI